MIRIKEKNETLALRGDIGERGERQMENEGEFGHSQMGVPRGTWESFSGEGRVNQVLIQSRPPIFM